MKGILEFDPDEYTYGESTIAVRTLVKEWANVDWFAPATGEPRRLRAIRLFEEHHAATHAKLPDVFGARVEVRSRLGDWKAFRALYEQVSAEVRYRKGEPTAWDWKFGGLKAMTRAHSEARGFRLDDVAKDAAQLHSHGPGDLFFKVNEGVIWNWVGPKLDLRERLPAREAEVGNWYVNYANMDLTEAIEWQLAERSDDLATNPFVPLLRCYAEGFYPFSLAPNEVVLFGFAAG